MLAKVRMPDQCRCCAVGRGKSDRGVAKEQERPTRRGFSGPSTLWASSSWVSYTLES